MDYLAAMRTFVRIVERGSISAAARDLGVGQSSVSERIKRTEETLGARLLRRNTRAISMTQAGAVFYEHSKLAIAAADEAVAAVRAGSSASGTIRIAAPQGLGELLLPQVARRIQESFADQKIDLVLNDRIVDPVTEGVDLSLRLGAVTDGRFVARRLGEVQRVLVASGAYLERHGRPSTPDELVRHRFGRVSGLFSAGTLPLEDANAVTLSAAIETWVTVSHWRPLQALILRGGCIGVLQEPACRDEMDDGRLVRVLDRYRVPALDLHLLYLPGQTSQRVKKVMLLVEEEVARLLEWAKS